MQQIQSKTTFTTQSTSIKQFLFEELRFYVVVDHLVTETEKRRQKREMKSKSGRYLENDDSLIQRGRQRNTNPLVPKQTQKYDRRLESKISEEDIIKWIAIVISMGIRGYKNRSHYFEWNSDHLGLMQSSI